MEHDGPVPRQALPEAAWDGRGVEARHGEALGFFGQDAHRDETGSVCATAGIPVSRAAEDWMPRRRLRAAFLTPSLLLGGAERWLISLARASREGIEWTGTALTERARAHAELLRELAACMPDYAGPRAASPEDEAVLVRCRHGREALERAVEDADVLIVWGLGNLARFVAGLTLPVVYVAHGGSPRVIRSSEAGATHLAAVSEAARMCFSPPVRPAVTVLHNGIDVERCTASVPRESVRAAWGFGGKHRLIGYVGRYSPEKNPAAAARAARELGVAHSAVYLGQGPMEAQLRSAVGADTARVRFVPAGRQVGNVLGALDALVLASPAEGFSLSITEAWYCRVPVVATEVGAIPELQRRHGRLVSAVPVDPTPGQLARALRRAWSPEFRQVVVPRAYEAVCRHYTARSMGRRWVDYLEGVVGWGKKQELRQWLKQAERQAGRGTGQAGN